VVLAAIFAVVAVLAAAAAIIYYTKTAQSLPSFMPGRRPGIPTHDTTRGLAAIFAAAFALVICTILLGISRRRGR
jgi:NADH:ubiquinone oxidoreductase subunit 2 (subunit N)